jgi:WD40 repeat protein
MAPGQHAAARGSAAAPPAAPFTPTWTLDLHEQAIGHLADGKGEDILIAADGSGAVRFWNLAKGEEIRSFQPTRKAKGLMRSPSHPTANSWRRATADVTSASGRWTGRSRVTANG